MSIHTNTYEDLAALSELPDETEIILNPPTVSKITGLSRRTLERQRHERTGIPFIRIAGNRTGYLLRDVRNFIRERRVETGGDSQ